MPELAPEPTPGGTHRDTPARAANSRGGRPSREAAQLLRERILEAATDLMLDHGYGATSIEAVATRAGVSKRTFYHRFPDKAALVQAVVARVVDAARPQAAPDPRDAGELTAALCDFGRQALRAALSPRVLALYRLIVAESGRFPDLLQAVALSGGRAQAVEMLSRWLLLQHPQLPPQSAQFAAQQYLQMLVSLPQLRALGIGDPMPADELEQWVAHSARLLLDGVAGLARTERP